MNHVHALLLLLLATPGLAGCFGLGTDSSDLEAPPGLVGPCYSSD